MKKKIAVLTLLVLALGQLSASDDQDPDFLGIGLNSLLKEFSFKTSQLSLNLSDHVTDGCMSDPQAVKDVWEVELRRLDFKIATEMSTSTWNLNIKAMGGGDDGFCSVVLKAELESPAVTVTTEAGRYIRGFVPLWSDSILLTGSKSSMQSRLMEKSREGVSRLYLKIKKADE